MGKRHRLLWLILALCLQGVAVLWMVGRYELILRLGTEVRLPCPAAYGRKEARPSLFFVLEPGQQG